MIVDNALQTYNKAFEKLVAFFQDKTNRYSCIGAAIACILLQRLYSSIALPPRNLLQFPRIPTLAILNSFKNNESIPDRIKRLVNPIARAPISWNLFVAEPNAAKVVLMKTDNFPKTHNFFGKLGGNTPVSILLGKENVAVSNGEVWRKQRKIMNPAFHRSQPIKTFGSVMPYLFAAIDEESERTLITKHIKAFTLDALGLAVFGFDFQSLRGDPQKWTETYHIVMSSIFNPLSNIFIKFGFILKHTSAKFIKTQEATARLVSMMEDLANERRQRILAGDMKNLADQEKDLLTMMIEADIEEGTKTTTTQLRQNIALFFLAGHDTTANAISFCLYNIAKNPDIQQKLREEITSVLGEDPVDIVPTMEDLKKMDYLNLVIKENLRRSGPVDRIISRDATEDFVINGTLIPKGTQLNIDIGSLHFNPKLWQDPKKFIPERFVPGGEYESHEGFAYLPFGNGARQCIGMNFSLTEQKVVIAMLVRKYMIEVPKDSIHYDKVQFDMPMTISPESLDLKFSKLY
ncbi:hypothetical protein [Parasitella parasitica]|uniref:Cytochrome P450 n=1 Tax=Parasitella parasitica TaxID=35722 RepID=A0A0B7NRH8_9FUNG|nr:hypothetical protein [Parasitella parasitica]